MTTLKDKAVEYANRIRQATFVYEVKVASAGQRNAAASATQTVRSVLKDIDSLETDAGPLTDVQVQSLLLAIDDALDVQSGTMRMIKESSVRALLQYNQLVTDLMQQLMAQQ